MEKEKVESVRICVTLPKRMLENYRELSQMVNRPVSWLIRRRLEIRGAIIAVPVSMEERMIRLYELLEQIKSCGTLSPQLYAEMQEHVRQCAQLIDFESSEVFLHYNKKKIRAKRKTKTTQVVERGATVC